MGASGGAPGILGVASAGLRPPRRWQTRRSPRLLFRDSSMDKGVSRPFCLHPCLSGSRTICFASKSYREGVKITHQVLWFIVKSQSPRPCIPHRLPLTSWTSEQPAYPSSPHTFSCSFPPSPNTLSSSSLHAAGVLSPRSPPGFCPHLTQRVC